MKLIGTGVTAVVLLAAASTFWVAEGAQRTTVTNETPVFTEMGGGGSGHGGEGSCSGCFCCFPKTPDGNITVNGFLPIDGQEKIVYQVPHDSWFMATDIEVVALDAEGRPVSEYAVGVFEVDSMNMHGGMRMTKRWGNCGPYHSARGIPFMPMCDVTLDRINAGTQPPAASSATQIYYQINGYLWEDSGSHTSH